MLESMIKYWAHFMLNSLMSFIFKIYIITLEQNVVVDTFDISLINILISEHKPVKHKSCIFYYAHCT